MSADKRIFILVHAEARRRALAAVAEAPEGSVVSVGAPVRNGAQNALLHASLGEIAEVVEWAGKKREIEVWKRLLVAAWLRARGTSVEILPALDGRGVDLVYSPTSSLSKAEFAELIDYIEAWKADRPEFAEAAGS